MKKEEVKIVGAFILGCTEPGKEGIVDMGCKYSSCLVFKITKVGNIWNG
jgi:hypothetical protein